MITEFKIFEYFNEEPKIGDKVICIDDSSQDILIIKHVYKIKDIRKYARFRQYKLIDVKYYWTDNRFRSGTPEEIERLEMEQDSKKYNL